MGNDEDKGFLGITLRRILRLRPAGLKALFRGHPRFFRWTAVLLVVSCAALYEMRTSAFSSRALSYYAGKLSYRVEPGPSPNIVFPRHGPYDIRTGYALIPDFVRRLGAAGYTVTRQVRFSRELERVAGWGILPPYPEPTSTKLRIRGNDGQPLFAAPLAEYHFESFEAIPPLVVKGLLIIENRELDQPADARTNPVVDWDRLAKAIFLYAGNRLGLPLSVEGGSTLATQMQKFRHSDEGRTDSVLAKLRQMTDASLRVYQGGMDTREERRRIVLNYLNSIPLAATPGYGEIHGLGNGLYSWFGLDFQQACKVLGDPAETDEKARIFKQVMALLCAVRAPSHYLLNGRAALENRVDFYVRFLAEAGAISGDFARRVQAAPVAFSARPPRYSVPFYAENKAVNEIRANLTGLLGVPGLYELDRLHLDVESTIDPVFQHRVATLFAALRDPAFIAGRGLGGERLLGRGDPSRIIYGLILVEKTPRGNLVRGITDNLDAPFDINTGMKMQLGSTAKLRVLAHYLDIAATLHGQFARLDAGALERERERARDPITRWAVKTLGGEPRPRLEAFLELALDRRYSAGTGERFFTGGGLHTFGNFNRADGGRIVTVREATRHSINLVYVRLMRDLVDFHAARLPYDTEKILAEPDHPVRRRMLRELAEEESRHFLREAWRAFRKRDPAAVLKAFLGEKAPSPRHLAITFYSWHRGGDAAALARWMERFGADGSPQAVERWVKAYGNPRLGLSDYGYLLGEHPLRLWAAGALFREPELSWEELWARSGAARQVTAVWLLKEGNRAPQERRLRIRFEQDAFRRMTPAWRRLGFPFDSLVPSLATALGSSGDRPEALAELMGILLNDGEHRPGMRITRLRFAENTPYETVLEPDEAEGRRVLPRAVARAILPVLAGVVESGTAARLSGAFVLGDRPLVAGGKTGSGDNRVTTVDRGGRVLSSRAIDRTATFVFYIGDRYYGVLTAFVPGSQAGEYRFTSALPVSILKILAPDIESLRRRSDAIEAAEPPHPPGPGVPISNPLPPPPRGNTLSPNK